MIEFRNVKKVYPNGTVALDGINLRIADGEFVFIVGSSGAGKSTLTKLLLREEQVTSGKLTVDEFDLVKMPEYKVPYYRRQLGVVFQDFRLFPTKTVYENVAFAMRAVGASPRLIKKRVPYVLNLVGLDHKANSLPTQLSGGEQQRVAIARALVNNPSMIIADEPTGNLDPRMALDIMHLLEQINELGTTVLVVTHARELVDMFSKRVVAIEEGRIISDKTGGYYQNETV